MRVERQMIGDSPAINGLRRAIEKVAQSSRPVLIQGESGVGKELVASEVFRLSDRNTKPFVTADMPGFTESLIESELFGHDKGAFTGAVNAKQGLFEEADNGTLFLDEIAELPLALQAKLLRVLETGEVRRVGHSRSVYLDLRIIAATNRRLEEEVEKGTFRKDLFYRLSVLPVAVPPLRERREDIPLIARHFLEQEVPSGHRSISPCGMHVLTEYSWPGNVRQLRNTIIQAAVLGEEHHELDAEHLRRYIARDTANSRGASLLQESPAPRGGPFPTLREAKDVATAAYLKEVLRRTGGRPTRAAEIAGIKRTAFYRLCRIHGVPGSRGRMRDELLETENN
jgi:DNA-binding NtrC family response regulator